jgi:molybdopterin/thiamine biosynthesis adenylyltransferase
MKNPDTTVRIEGFPCLWYTFFTFYRKCRVNARKFGVRRGKPSWDCTKELKRYNRQMMIKGWGEETQGKIKASTVFIAGAGGLGSPVSIYLAVAGVGTIRICDFDSPDWTNLNRQILHNHHRIGINKALSAKLTLEELNPDVRIEALTDKIIADNVDELVGDADLIMDCTDNFQTRYLLNESAIRKNIPLIHGSIWGLDGRLTFIQPPGTPFLSCYFPESPSEEIFPVLGATPWCYRDAPGNGGPQISLRYREAAEGEVARMVRK